MAPKAKVITKWFPKNVIAAAREESRKNVLRAAIYARDQAKVLLNVGGGGQPSTAPDPPHKQSGDLQRSITAEVVDDGGDILGGIGSNVAYARRQEEGFHGTDSLGRAIDQPARPYLRPAIRNNKAMILKIIRGRG